MRLNSIRLVVGYQVHEVNTEHCSRKKPQVWYLTVLACSRSNNDCNYFMRESKGWCR